MGGEAGAAGGPVRLESLEGGQLWRVVLATPKANIVDRAKVERLAAIFEEARRERNLKAVVVDHEGPNFSFGASVEEHLPEQVHAMIRGFHDLFARMLESGVCTVAVVRGVCLGGGLELASFCQRVVAAPDAKLGQPEIALGVFAPVASVALVERVGRGAAEEICLSGRSLSAEEALALGLVDQLAEDPGEAAREWVRQHLLPRSAESLRFAVRALRVGFARRFRNELAEVERLYLDELMATSDANEGLRAFLEKRKPVWTNG